MLQIICVGDLCCDLIVPYGKMKEALASGDISKETTGSLQVVMQCGGSVGNVARHLGRMEAHPVFVTPLRKDSLGEFLSSGMEESGVDMRWTAPSEKSNMYCVAVLDESGERTMFCFVPPWADFPRFQAESFREVPGFSGMGTFLSADASGVSDRGEVLFTSGMAILDDAENNAAVLRFFRDRKGSGAKIVFDLNVRAESYGYEGERRRAMEEMIALSDVVLGSGREEFCQVTGRHDIREAAEQLLLRGAGTVVARDGGRPVLILGRDEAGGAAEAAGGDGGNEEALRSGMTGTWIPVKPVRPVSTLGAGDSFDAKFLCCIASGEEISAAVREASDYAADYISGKK